MTDAQHVAKVVDRLSKLETDRQWIVSCYLKLEPRDRSRRKYFIKLKNRIKRQLQWLEDADLSRNDKEKVKSDLEKVQRFFENPGNLGTGRGMAVFAAAGLDLFEPVSLPTVFRSRLAVDRTPLIRELVAISDEFGLMCCAVYDRTSARFFRVSAFGAEEVDQLEPSGPSKSKKFSASSAPTGRGSSTAAAGEHNFQQRIKEQKHRHFAHIAQRLDQVVSAYPVRGLVLAGVGAGAGAVEPHLSPRSRELLMGTTRLSPKKATPAQVVEAVFEVRRDAERASEQRHVDEWQEQLGSGWAVNGIERTLSALARGQVRTLLVDPEVVREGFRCSQSGKLTLVAGHCRGEGSPEPVQDVIDEGIEEALNQGCHLDVLEDDELAARIDKLAGILRFKQR